jgi:hypothetical protein
MRRFQNHAQSNDWFDTASEAQPNRSEHVPDTRGSPENTDVSWVMTFFIPVALSGVYVSLALPRGIQNPKYDLLTIFLDSCNSTRSRCRYRPPHPSKIMRESTDYEFIGECYTPGFMHAKAMRTGNCLRGLMMVSFSDHVAACATRQFCEEVHSKYHR